MCSCLPHNVGLFQHLRIRLCGHPRHHLDQNDPGFSTVGRSRSGLRWSRGRPTLLPSARPRGAVLHRGPLSWSGGWSARSRAGYRRGGSSRTSGSCCRIDGPQLPAMNCGNPWLLPQTRFLRLAKHEVVLPRCVPAQLAKCRQAARSPQSASTPGLHRTRPRLGLAVMMSQRSVGPFAR